MIEVNLNLLQSDELPADTLEASDNKTSVRGSYNPMQFVLRLRGDIHRILKTLPPGMYTPATAQHKKIGKKKIDLRYFSETKRQIEDFFHVAGLIIQRKATLDPSKNAMREIINGCKTASDVILKKNKLFEDLKSYNIYVEEHHDYYKSHAFVIEDPSIINALKKSTEDSHRVFYPEEAHQVLSLFTKINVLRKGINNTGLERIGYIFLTGTKASLLWAHNNLIKQNDKDIPFANSMDFITDKFWFKLKKGLNEKKALPKSQDIISRAQMVLASQLNNSISRRYNELTQKAKQGVLTQPEAIATYAELRELVVNPEDITPEIIDESLAFLNDDNVETFLHERSSLLKKVKEAEETIKALKKIKATQDQQERRPKKRQVKVYYMVMSSFILLAIIAIPILLWLFIKAFISTQDTTIGIASFLLAVLIEFIAIIRTAKPLHKKLKRKTRLLYLRLLEPLQ